MSLADSISSLLIPSIQTPAQQNQADLEHQQMAVNNQTEQQNASLLQLQQEQRKAQIAQLQQKTLATKNYLANPRDVNNYIAFTALNPEAVQGAKEGYNAMTDEAKKVHLNDLSSVYGYAKNGTYAPVVDILNARRATEAQAKQDTSSTDAEIELAKKAAAGDKDAGNQLLALSQHDLGAILPADQFKAITGFDLDQAKQQAEIDKLKADTGKTTAETNTLIPAQAAQANAAANKDNADANGEVKAIENPSSGEIDYYSNRKGPLQTSDSSDQSQFSQFTSQLLGTETSPNQSDNVKNPNSSATGRSQAINSTWLETIKQNFPEIAKGKSDAQILALRGDPVFSQQAAKEIIKSKVGALTRMGLPVNKATAALAYKLGEGNAQKILSAPVDTPLEQVLDAKTIAANPQLKGQTVKSYSQGLVNQFGTDPIQIGDPTANGEQFLESLPRGVAAQVKAIADGDVPAPTSKMGTTPMGSSLMQKVKQYDPTFVASRFTAKQALGSQATPEGKSLNAMNTLIGHLDEYAHLAQDRNSASGPLGNAIGNIASAATGGRVSKIVSRMNDLRNTIAGERARVLGIDDKDGRKAMGDLLDPSKDATTLLTDVGQITQTAQDRVNAIFDQYQQQTGQKADVNKFIYPSTQSRLKRIQQLANQREPNRGEISYLISNPNTAAQFDKTFGTGQAERYFKMSAH